MPQQIVLYWFRQDLRLSDNPALQQASVNGDVLPIYILDDTNNKQYPAGEASKWWLYHSLVNLNKSLNCKLCLYKGDPEKIIFDLIDKYNISKVFWNRCYEPWQIKRDKILKQNLLSKNINVISENSFLLWEPWQVLKQDGTPFKVFTPFYQYGCLSAPPPRTPLPIVKNLTLFKDPTCITTLEQFKLLPKIKWYQSIAENWQPGEAAAQTQLENFLAEGIDDYKNARDFPALQKTSKLSPYLHFGEISPNQIWYAAKQISNNEVNQKAFLSELGWREFSYNLLYYFPELPKTNWRNKFNNFPWNNNKVTLQAWQTGQTGIPIVDAGMRELWQTGYMHNRVRMIVASFLVKNLLQHWHHGADWFWNCLLDADLANNSASWQWVAGCGADAAPYFRIFNPVLQGQKFDPQGIYIRQYIPELKLLPEKYLFSPWEAPEDILTQAKIKLGIDYPMPIVDLKASRVRALTAFKEL
jgi:deoxyribodipyrimidine photo-lyase